MRVLAPTPENNVSAQVVDGYQLCARCGEVMIIGESAVVVRRFRSWLIYSHPLGPKCPPQAVRGWNAVRSADGIRKFPNKEVYRPAGPQHIGGSLRECVCLLDDEHIEAELELVEYHGKERTGRFREFAWSSGHRQAGKRREVECATK
jgi:hypothetical protein